MAEIKICHTGGLIKSRERNVGKMSANSTKRKTAKTENAKNVSKEPVTTGAEEVEESMEKTVEEPAKKEDNTSAATDTSGIQETDGAAAVEEPRKKRKYTRRVTKTDSKAPEKQASKKPKKDNKTEGSIQEVYIEYQEDKISSNEVISKIQENYKNEGHRISSIKKLQVYMNILERKAYYVINDKPEGKYVEF